MKIISKLLILNYLRAYCRGKIQLKFNDTYKFVEVNVKGGREFQIRAGSRALHFAEVTKSVSVSNTRGNCGIPWDIRVKKANIGVFYQKGSAYLDVDGDCESAKVKIKWRDMGYFQSDV